MSQDEVQMIFDRDLWVCQYLDEDGNKCNKRAVEPAHRVSQGKQGRAMVKEYFASEFDVDLSGAGVDMVIHHEFNAVAVCSDKTHNSSFALNMATQKNEIARLMESIYRDLVIKGLIGGNDG